LFRDKNPQYTQSSNGNLPNQELVNELNGYADKNGFVTKTPANNDELIDYAALLFTSVAAAKVIDYTRTQLLKDKTYTAGMGAKMYNLVNNEMKDDIIDQNYWGRTWSDDVWRHQSALRSDLLTIMRQSLLEKENPVSHVADIRDRYHVFNYQSERILRTEGAHISAMQQKHDIKAAGYDLVEWITSAGACDHCLDKDGKIYKLNNVPPIPFHPSCRCSIAAVAKDEVTDSDIED